jgi:hypothetical protein
MIKNEILWRGSLVLGTWKVERGQSQARRLHWMFQHVFVFGRSVWFWPLILTFAPFSELHTLDVRLGEFDFCFNSYPKHQNLSGFGSFLYVFLFIFRVWMPWISRFELAKTIIVFSVNVGSTTVSFLEGTFLAWIWNGNYPNMTGTILLI